MRCHEALNRLSQLGRSGDNLNRELLEHLKSCAACARHAEAARELNRAFAEMSTRDETDQIVWPEQIHRVEAAARARRNQPKEMPIMTALKRQFRLRPKLSVGLAATLVVLLAATLIPMKFDQTVGFEVAVAGVDRDLALNQNRLFELQERLAQLGLTAAHVDVTGCEATCNLVVSNLISKDDANLVAEAFKEIGENHVTMALNELKEEVSVSVVNRAMHKIFVFEIGDNSHSDGPRSKSFLFADQDSTTAEHPVGGVWIGEPPASDSGIPVGGVLYVSEYDLSETEEDSLRIALENPLPQLEGRHWHNGLEARHWLNDTITDAARAEFAAQGWKVELSDDKKTATFSRINDTGESAAEIQETDKEAALPEGYSLSQNYPNPFNPTTQIDFTVPRTEHVTLEVYNINGQKVRTLLDEAVSAGGHTVTWDATSDSGEQVASGVYLYRLTTGKTSASRKMMLVK